jgi:periplasmic protein TonB
MMPSILKSFSYSFFFHVGLVLVLSALMPKEESFSPSLERVIKLQLGGLGKKRGGENPQSLRPEVASTKTVLKESVQDIGIQANSAVNTSESSGGNTATASGSGVGGGESFEKSIQHYSEPIYPRIAIKRELQGSIRVKIEVGENGIPQNISILKSSGHKILDESALDAIKKWIFQKRGNISYFVEKTIVFELRS